jgi:hypothetical protein
MNGTPGKRRAPNRRASAGSWCGTNESRRTHAVPSMSTGIMRLPSPYACEIGIDAICVSDGSMRIAATM